MSEMVTPSQVLDQRGRQSEETVLAGTRPRTGRRTLLAAASAVTILFTLVACGDDKKYDIGPIFPLSADKCSKYNGEAEGSGPLAKCLVSKDDCERAAADWRQAMKNIPNALDFRC